MTNPGPEDVQFPLDMVSQVVPAALEVAFGSSGLLGIALASSGPAIKLALSHAAGAFQAWRHDRVQTTIGLAAKFAGLDPKELLERLSSAEDNRDLFMHTMRVVQESGSERKLVALAQSLSNTAGTSDPGVPLTEMAFVRAVDSLDPSHMALLEFYGKTFKENGLSGTDDTVHEWYDALTLQRCLPEFAEQLPALAAVLQAQGLMVYRAQSSGAMVFAGNTDVFQITRAGREFLSRMLIAADFLRRLETERQDP